MILLMLMKTDDCKSFTGNRGKDQKQQKPSATNKLQYTVYYICTVSAAEETIQNKAGQDTFV